MEPGEHNDQDEQQNWDPVVLDTPLSVPQEKCHEDTQNQKPPPCTPLTIAFVRKCTTQKQMRHESDSQYLKRITHINLSNRRLSEVPLLPKLPRVQVLYMYRNFLTKVEHLNRLRQISSLFLEDNRLESLQGIRNLPRLTKLCLNGNRIETLEGLDECPMLQELYIANQKLGRGISFTFDPNTMNHLSRSLTTLQVSNNKVKEIVPLCVLGNLEVFKADHNELSNLEEVSQVLQDCFSLREVDLIGNPVCSEQSYRDTIILRSELLNLLDGKQIRENQRHFLYARRARRQAMIKQGSRYSLQTANSNQSDPSTTETISSHRSDESGSASQGMLRANAMTPLAEQQLGVSSTAVYKTSPLEKHAGFSVSSFHTGATNKKGAIATRESVSSSTKWMSRPPRWSQPLTKAVRNNTDLEVRRKFQNNSRQGWSTNQQDTLNLKGW